MGQGRVGSILDGVRDGVGVEVRADGGALAGTWRGGQLHGDRCAYLFPCADGGALVGEWRDGSAWKRAFAREHPGNTYVEVQDYFTKCLADWNRDGRGEDVTADHLDRARAALERFDAVFVVERDRSQRVQR